MQLSRNFSLGEFTKSQTALRNGVSNQPNDEQVENIKSLVENVLQPLMDMLRCPIIISSGFRSFELNKLVGGSDNSQHSKGEAVDIECTGCDNFELAVMIKNNFDFDQLIIEFYDGVDPHSGWVHVSYRQDGKNRKSVLTATVDRRGKVKYTNGLTP